MLKRWIRLVLTATVLIVALVPLRAFATESVSVGAPSDVYDLRTRYFDPYGTAGNYVGRLKLRISPSGIVNGTYRDDDGVPSFVTGGLIGRKIWLSFTINKSTIRIEGTLENGAIHGSGRVNSSTWNFDATPDI